MHKQFFTYHPIFGTIIWTTRNQDPNPTRKPLRDQVIIKAWETSPQTHCMSLGEELRRCYTTMHLASQRIYFKTTVPCMIRDVTLFQHFGNNSMFSQYAILYVNPSPKSNPISILQSIKVKT